MKRNHIKHKYFLITGAFFLLFTSVWLGATAQNTSSKVKKQPNIILIMADDLGYETLGCNGNDDKLTPNLDKLASTGMLFSNCHSTPLCTPSRVQLMTGKYNNRNYIGFGLLDPKEQTFGHALQKQGYKTCIAGKWQLYGNDKQFALAGGLKGTMPENAGFDNFCVWQANELGSRYKDPTVYTDERKNVTLKGQYGDDVFVNYIEKFMEDNRNGPFMVYYPMALTHDPFVPTPFSDDFSSSTGATKGDPKYFKDMVKYMDHLTGRIFRKVDELGIRDNTIIIFIGDNGTSPKIGSRFRGGIRYGNKGQTNDRGTHVPCIINWKGGIKDLGINSSLVDFTDFFPTLMDIASVKKEDSMKLDGISLYPQLFGDKSNPRDWIFCYYDPNWGTFKKKVFVYDKSWKLYETGEVYDLVNDPDELKPIAKSSLSPQAAKRIGLFEQVMANKLKSK